MCYQYKYNDFNLKNNNISHINIFNFNNQNINDETYNLNNDNEGYLHMFLVSLCLSIFYYFLFKIINIIK